MLKFVFVQISVVVLYSDLLVLCVSFSGWFMVFLTGGLNDLTVISSLNDIVIV